MKSLSPTIMAIIICILAVACVASAAEAPQEAYSEGFAEAVVPAAFASTQPPPEPSAPSSPAVPRAAQPVYFTQRSGVAYSGMPMGTAGQAKVLMIPSAEVKAEDLAAITEDIQVMSHIFERKFKGGRQIGGVFVDFGDFFGRDSRVTRAIYLQGYGVLFLMEGNFPLSAPPEPQGKQPEKAKEPVDATWEEAKQEVFSPEDTGGSVKQASGPEYDAQKVEEFKTELIKTLKHASNIRNLKADEWVILTVIGAGGRPIEGGMMVKPGATMGAISRPTGGMYGTGGYGAVGGYFASSGGYGGGFGGMGGYSYGPAGTTSSTTLTMRVKKADVDAYAKGEINFEQFQQKVKIFTY